MSVVVSSIVDEDEGREATWQSWGASLVVVVDEERENDGVNDAQIERRQMPTFDLGDGW